MRNTIWQACRCLVLPLSEIESQVSKCGLVLDIGCGFGLASLYFAISSPNRKVIGLDINQKRIKVAKQACQSINNLTFKIDDLASHQHQTIDTITIIDVLHHLSQLQKEKLINQCYCLLSPRGKLIIKDINTKPYVFYLWNYVHDLIFNSYLGSTLDFLNTKQMINLLNKNHFQIVDSYPLKRGPYPHYLYVCQKK